MPEAVKYNFVSYPGRKFQICFKRPEFENLFWWVILGRGRNFQAEAVKPKAAAEAAGRRTTMALSAIDGSANEESIQGDADVCAGLKKPDNLDY